MTAIAAFHDRFPRGGDVSDANIVGQKKSSLVARILAGVAVFALLMLVILPWRQGLITDGFAQGKVAAEQAVKAKLDAQRDEITQLKAEVSKLEGANLKLDGDLKLAIQREGKKGNALKVLAGERNQAVKDLKTVVAAVSAKGAPPKKLAAPPANRQQQRRG